MKLNLILNSTNKILFKKKKKILLLSYNYKLNDNFKFLNLKKKKYFN